MGTFLTFLMGPIAGLGGSLLSNLFSGVGSFVKEWQARESMKLQQGHEVKLLEMQINARSAEREDEAFMHQMNATSDMLTASYRHDASYGQPSQKVTDVLRFVRPILTLILLIFDMIIFFVVGDKVIMEVDGDLVTMQERVVISIINMTEMAFTWWFADRQLAKLKNKV